MTDLENLAQIDKTTALRAYFRESGLLLCNINNDLPSLETVGGDWAGIISLIEQGEVFYSKVFKNRVSYLSAQLYFLLKPYKQRTCKLSAESRRMFDFICAAELATSKEIKAALGLSSKTFTFCMDALFKELFVTAVKRDKTLNANWSSFYWGTFEVWERRQPRPDVDGAANVAGINDLLGGIMTEKQIKNLLS